MTDVRFYHLTRQSAQQALPDLLEKTLARGWRAVVKLPDEAQVAAMDAHLWQHRADSFLPHGSVKDGRAEEQPLWLTTLDENPNEASVLFVIGAEAAPKADGFDLVCDVFDGQEDAAVAAARARWAAYKGQGHALTYWQQGERGWQKKDNGSTE
ncbi:MAG: DNA polymerase III subunit chi [Bdellovibrionales bacterium]|jgi:DNA polymerase-3 subunit chi